MKKLGMMLTALVLVFTLVAGSLTVFAAGETAADKAPTPDDVSGFVLVSEVVPDVMQDMRYYSTNNFLGERIDGYEEPVALLTKEAAEALKKVSDLVTKKGYRLKIFDAYRPQAADEQIMKWTQDKKNKKMKEYFYPNLDKEDLVDEGWISETSANSHGSTVCVTLYDMENGKDFDMGTSFDFMDDCSRADNDTTSFAQDLNREILVEFLGKLFWLCIYFNSHFCGIIFNPPSK